MNLNLNQIFNRSEFIEWINEFLPNFNLNIQKVDTPNSFKGVVSIETLGESNLGIRVFVIETDNDPAKRRVGWATDSFSVLKNSGSSNALIAYYSKDTSQWRISLLTSSPIWGDGKVILRLSNPKRQSYVLGPKAKIKTPHQFLLTKGRVTSLDDLKTRFSLEVVNKEFYKEISKLFTELVGGTIAVNKKKMTFEPLIRLPSIDIGSTVSLEFAVRLIGRIIFCWFLREKRSSSGDSLMPKELVSLESVDKNSDYYHKVLEPIFFEVLNKPQKSRNEPFDTGLFSKIPYLNGGLFSPQKDSDFYEKGRNDLQSKFHNTLVIPDKWIKSLFEVLETYNFTIDENTSFDEELSIDPEMLGRIFENLLAEINPETGESARKSTGSYYTPRIIVDYMVDESLCLYLKEKTGIEEKKLRSLISYDLGDDTPLTNEEKDKIIKYLGEVKILDPACGSGAFPIGALQKIVFILQQIDPKAEKMYELEIRKVPSEFKRVIQREYEHGSFDYLRKLMVIRDCIYGVDIQPIATEISRLRCFLTLVVDQGIDDTQENRGIQPLPNLDFKFVTANSLIGIPKIAETQQLLFDERKNIQELKIVMKDFFQADQSDKFILINEFNNIQKKLIKQYYCQKDYSFSDQKKILSDLGDWEPFTHKSTPWFDSEWMFGLVDGFDIVIANPPYLGNKGHKDEFQLIQAGNLGLFYERRMDLFYFFFHLAIKITSNTGVIAFVTTNYYPTATGAKKLRKDIKENTTIKKLINFNELKIFESALGQHNMLTILSKPKDDMALTNVCVSNRTGVANQEILQNIIGLTDIQTDCIDILNKDIFDGDEDYIRLNNSTENSKSLLYAILNKIKTNGESMGALCNVNQGIVTGADKVSEKHIRKFNIGAKKGDGIYILSPDEISEKKINLKSEHIKPWYKNSDIKKYWTNQNIKEYVLYFKDKKIVQPIEDEIKNHFEKYKDILISRLSVCKKNKFQWNIVSKWINRGEYYLLFYPRKQEIFESEKIVVPQRSTLNNFGYSEKPWYAASDVFFITTKDNSVFLKYILALINSKLYYLWLKYRGKRKGKTLELIAKPLSEIPIKKISESEQKPFIEVVDKILEITKSEDYLDNQEKQQKVKDYEKQIDQMVYKLYELTDEEIKVVESEE